MQYGFARTYVYFVLGLSLINLLLGLLYVSTKNIVLSLPLAFFSFAEVIPFILSIVIIVNVFIKQLKKINLVLPVYYLTTAILIGAYDIVAGPDTGDMSVMESFLLTFDLSIPYSFNMFWITVVDYIFMIGFCIYLLRDPQRFVQGRN